MYEQEDEILTIVAQEVLLIMGGIMVSYSCIAIVGFEGIFCMFLLWYNDIWVVYSYDLWLFLYLQNYVLN